MSQIAPWTPGPTWLLSCLLNQCPHDWPGFIAPQSPSWPGPCCTRTGHEVHCEQRSSSLPPETSLPPRSMTNVPVPRRLPHTAGPYPTQKDHPFWEHPPSKSWGVSCFQGPHHPDEQGTTSSICDDPGSALKQVPDLLRLFSPFISLG